MSRDFDPPVDHALDELLDAAASAPDDESVHPPGFADVLSRLSDAPTPGVRLGPAHVDDEDATDDGPDDVLAMLVASARREAEADARRHAHPVAPLPRPNRRVAAVAGISLAAAAAAVLAFGVAQWSGLASRGADDETKEAAASQLDRDRELRQATPGTTDTPSATPRPVVRKRAPTPETMPEAEPELEAPTLPEDAAPLETVEPTTPELEADVAPHRPTRRTIAARLAELDARAQKQLAAGDTTGATTTLRKLIASGGKRSVVQLAYGDLFTLAHRGGTPTDQRKLWREYLTKFPKGRFAEDARSGLCRHATESTRQACWTDYLRDFPKGSYRGQAERVVAEAETP